MLVIIRYFFVVVKLNCTNTGRDAINRVSTCVGTVILYTKKGSRWMYGWRRRQRVKPTTPIQIEPYYSLITSATPVAGDRQPGKARGTSLAFPTRDSTPWRAAPCGRTTLRSIRRTRTVRRRTPTGRPRSPSTRWPARFPSQTTSHPCGERGRSGSSWRGSDTAANRYPRPSPSCSPTGGGTRCPRSPSAP